MQILDSVFPWFCAELDTMTPNLPVVKAAVIIEYL